MSSNFDIKGLGYRINFHRHRLGLTQSMLADKLHVSFQAISSWEKSASLPDIENLCQLSSVFGVPLDDLLRGEPQGPTLMIGVDGGGTKTEFVLFDQTGMVYKRVRLSGCNASLVGIEQTLKILMQGIDTCLDEKPDAVAAHVGIAGPKLDVVLKKLSERYPQMKISVISDGVNAFKSAIGDFALICGTGSIIITPQEKGYRRIGGWGARFGDPGSAYNFGRAALQYGFAYEDGIQDESLLYDLLIKKTGFSVLRPSVDGLDVAYIASLSAVVFDAFAKGSKHAADIIRKEMSELALLLDSAFPKGGRAVLCGGIMEHHASVLIPMLKEYLKSPIEFILPALPPIYGACVACCDEMGISIDESFEKKFSFNYLAKIE